MAWAIACSIAHRTIAERAVGILGNTSLVQRTVFLAAITAVIVFSLLTWILVSQYRANARQGLQEVQQAQLFSLIAAVEVSDQGVLNVEPNLGDTRFIELGSGWYWQVQRIDALQYLAASPSLEGQKLEGRPDLPFNQAFFREYNAQFGDGPVINVLETEIDLGEPPVPVRIWVTANLTEFERSLGQLRRALITLLSIVGLIFAAAIGVVVTLALRPLQQLQEAVLDVRNAQKPKVEGRYPREIQPVADEINTLIDNNRRIVERARTQVGNLAHSLKTPISVLLNAANDGKPVAPKLVDQQANAMNGQVQLYLKRAQIAAQSGGTIFRTNVNDVCRQLQRVIQKLNPEKSINLRAQQEAVTFAGERQDLEEVLGNLMENAAKWTRSTISVQVEAISDAVFSITVDDDGPGINETDRAIALKRGKRIDETVPGTGLGLAIVSEIVAEYKGTVKLLDSDLGGLRVEVCLPRIAT